MTRAAFLFALLLAASPLRAQSDGLDDLFDALRQPDSSGWEAVEDRIWEEWSQSGSAAMDLLLERGREAIGEGEHATAIEHLTALVENAPDFAEGWNARATAYFHVDRYGPALADIARALTLEPRHFAALAGLGRIFEETGDIEGALEAYRRAAAIHPRRPDLREAVERLEAELQGKSV
ncbi:tetratricopeptide repeat protein [Maritimibacter sp. HL-12]|jgi:tetratricopeptide (TPR) repeat protein|uniref:tetratricopeptide repeat protein n=1 Tax=Maritimibacter sp. HL-12 TaxID=1162418 RepID=UPI000A0F07E3|nr:tetratricopeptide repeat protein [Maritimibacter sp. HL-12]SMH54939.1 Tetratricopeptide repeat-containing protein [Maritimibacter sp. HL-12]